MENCSHCKMKNTPIPTEKKKSMTSRLNRTVGQLNGIKKMIEDGRYCDDILIQLAAADKAIKSVATALLNEHIHTCLIEEIQKGNVSAADEIVDLFRRFQ